MNFEPDKEYRFCTFYLGGERYAVDILAVREITRILQVTPARGSKACIRGLLNLRGQIVTVISPASVLSLPESEQTATTRLLVLKTTAELEARGIDDYRSSEDLISLWCERLSEVVAVPGSRVKTPPASAETVVNAETLDGVIELDDDIIRILNPDRLLQASAA